MTTNLDDVQMAKLGEQLRQTLRREAEQIDAEDRWDDIVGRLSSRVATGRGETVRIRRSSHRNLALGMAAAAVAMALISVGVLGGWQLSGRLRPAGSLPGLTVPHYNPGIPHLVVYRSNVSEGESESDWKGKQQPKSSLYLAPELMRTGDADVGLAALKALFETPPAHPSVETWWHGGQPSLSDNHDWMHWQDVDITSVTHTDGLIRVELNNHRTHLAVSTDAAEVMAQAWVYTLQDTLRTRDDVVITVQGQPTLLYGSVDTAKPLQRDETIRIKHYTGFDTPKDGDVVSYPFVLLGYADAAPSRPARLQIIDLVSETVVVDEQFTEPTTELGGPRDLRQGRYRCVLEGVRPDGKPYISSIVVTVLP